MPDFPLLDAPRTDTEGRELISDHGLIEPRIDEVDYWCSMPVRVTHSAGIGFALELGPYDLDERDIGKLRDAIASYDRAQHGPALRRIK